MAGSNSVRQTEGSDLQGRKFWEFVGKTLPPFFEAPSTQYYFECERLLLERHFPDLAGKRLLKTDLWDEAKNTRILNWADDQGAKVYGIDISLKIASEARAGFRFSDAGRCFILSDIRQMAFRDNSFDYLYSMGTIEHFPEHAQAISECFRVIRPGGTAIFGVPNRFDPFLRPLLVSVLNWLGLYSYGFEKSFSFRQLERILREVGFKTLNRTGILFLPGWLRMIDLLVHVKSRRSSFLFVPIFRFFSFIYKKSMWLRRQGYLIVCVVRKPLPSSS